MKITIKTLKGQLFNIEAQPQHTIQDVKIKIKQAKNFQVDAQKLVFKGKNTVNTDTLQALNIKQGDFMVVMVTIKKPQSKPEQPKPVQVPKVEEKPKQVQKPVESNKPVNVVNPPVNINPTNKSPTISNTQNSLVVGEQYQATILELMNMGFERQQVVNALKAAFNNPDRAVQYLLNGIPKGIQPSNQPVNPPPINQPQQNIPPVNLDSTLLANIINSPQFAQIKQAIRNDPSSLATFLQQIQANSPQLANLIQQNPELFERLIMEDNPLQGGQVPQPPPGSIMVTNQQKAAIDRLSALGFSKIEAAQAYMACDKNEQLAANLLFDRLQNGDIQGGESFPQQGPQQHDDKDDDDNLFS